MATANWTRRAALTLLAPLVVGSTGMSWEDRVLAAHNRERATLGIPPLAWDGALANNAQDWADNLARTGRFQHAPENRIEPEGENIWGGTRGYYRVEAAVDAWIAEKRHYRPGVFPHNSSTGRVEDIGHYTQLMWRTSGTVGCAKAQSREEDLVVCRYRDAGNWTGERPF